MTHICITFDYELFFGDNYGSYDEVLFDPTYELIDALEKKSVSATFFADVCSIPVAKKYEQYSYVEGFEKQLRYMINHGQDVQLHLHPHWYYSTWENDKWAFAKKGYRIHDFIEDGKMDSIIETGIEYLNNLLKPESKEYSCIAYRAGGFSLQPHDKLVEVLYKNGIRVDSSVAPHLYSDNGAQKYDYRHDLTDVNWYISPGCMWWENGNSQNGLFEIPIAVTDKNPFSFFVKRLLSPESIKLVHGPKRGSYISASEKKNTKISAIYNYFTGYNAISLDAYSAEYLMCQTNRLHKRLDHESAISVIGHPKLSDEKYIDNLCRYIELIQNDSKYDIFSIKNAYCNMCANQTEKE